MRTDLWRQGDVVSRGDGQFAATGRVVILRRHRDNQPFVLVEVQGGAGRLGKREFPDGWVLGIGRFEERCASCSQPFRSDAGHDRLCPACDRDDLRPDAESSTAARLRLRGNATRTAAPPAPAVTVPADDGTETPF